MKKKIRILFLTWKGMLIDLVIGRYAMKRATTLEEKVMTFLLSYPLSVTNNLIFLVECESTTVFQFPNGR